MEPDVSFDLDAYLRRINFGGRPQTDLSTLRALHRAHVNAIPFENLDIQMGHAVTLEPASLQSALVQRRRGGYCFQQNGPGALRDRRGHASAHAHGAGSRL
jgi:N-hydroxyarylamine O-acetyltransferase